MTATRAQDRLPTSASAGLGTTTLKVLVGGAALFIVVAGVREASGIIGPLVLALALTIVFHPLRDRLQRHMPSWAASVLLLIGVYAVLLVLGLALLVSAARLAQLLPDYKAQLNDQLSGVTDWLKGLGVDQSQLDNMKNQVDAGRVADFAISLLGNVAGVLSNLFFIVTLLLFMAFDGAQTKPLMAWAREHRPDATDAMASFARGTRTYLGVSAVFGLIVAVIDTVALWAMGVPGAFVWGVLAFVTNFIPNIGFVIGVVPPALMALLEGGWGLMLAVVAVYCVINFVIQSLIQPRYVGTAVGLSTTLTFLSLVFWAWVLGPLGALLAVPMSLFFKALLVEANPEARWLEPLVSGHPEAEN